MYTNANRSLEPFVCRKISAAKGSKWQVLIQDRRIHDPLQEPKHIIISAYILEAKDSRFIYGGKLTRYLQHLIIPPALSKHITGKAGPQT